MQQQQQSTTSSSSPDSSRVRPIGRGRGQRGRSTSPGRVGVGLLTRSPEERRSPPLERANSPTDPDETFGRMKLDASPTGDPTRGARRGARPDFSDTVHTRPVDLKTKQGSKGNPLRMVTNYFPLITGPMWKLYRYHVYFEPLMDEKNTRYRILKSHQEELGAYMYNGTNLFTSKPLPDNYKFQASAKDNAAVEVSFKETAPLEPGDPTYISFYNGILRRLLFGMELEQLGRNFFDRHAAINIPQHKLTLWPGYVTTLRQHENAVMLCVEVTHKVLRTDSVLHLMKEIEHNSRGDVKSAMVAEFKDTIVMTHYNRKTYHVDDVDFSMNPMKTFEKDGKPITYVDYYNARYNLPITDKRQALLLCRPTEKDIHRGQTTSTYLVPELCQATGLTDGMRANFTLMKELSKHLHMGPAERVKAINLFMSRLTGTKELCALMAKWGLQLHPKLAEVTGRVLGRETMLFNNGSEMADDKADWTKAFRSQKMLSSVNLDKWVILVPQRDAPNVENLYRTMAKVAAPLNMYIQNPVEIVKIMDIKPQGYVKVINSTLEKHANLQLLFVILPTNKLETYASVKKRLAVEVGMLSQCFVARNVTSKGLMSIATKVVVQMNAKLGGEPWSVKVPLKGLMVVGFDVHKGTKGVRGGVVGAMVSTTSDTFAKYHSTTSIYNSPDELCKQVMQDFGKCLTAYANHNQALPDRIILYRDGVGEGQLSQLVEVEIKNIVKCMTDTYSRAGRDVPKFTYIVVTKKINSRGFADKGGRYDNPPPGTIIDNVITLPERYDFFLVSCAARQGTVSPCSYNILYDTQGLDPDKIQLLTYKMCHMYFNWSGTVAVPAPCQYAHKLAFLTATAYTAKANDSLAGLLHFL